MATEPRRKQPKPTSDDDGDAEASEPTEVEPVLDEVTGEELGEVAGGGKITDLGGDGPSS
jgi:hypothetical protein